MEQRNLSSNLWKYTLILISKKRIFVAILGAYYLTVQGVDAAGVGIILLVGSLAGFILEIPSGYVSDKLGHKQALVISQVLIFLSSLLFLLASNLWMLVIAGVLLNAGTAFHSGTGSAFMHETLRGLGRTKEYSKLMGKMSSLGFGVPIILMVLIPFLVEIDLKLPFIIAVCLDLLGFIPALLLVTPKVPPEEVKEIGTTNFRQVMREGHRLHFFGFAVFSALVGGFLFSVSGFRAPYQTILAIPVIWFGVFFGLGRVLASLLLAYSGKMKGINTMLSFYNFQLVVYACLIFVLGLAAAPWVVVTAFLLINAFQWGLSKIDEGYLMDIIHTSKFKATLLSAKAQIGHIVAGLTSLGLGLVIQHSSYQMGFLLTGFVFLISTIPVYAYIRRKYGDILVHI